MKVKELELAAKKELEAERCKHIKHSIISRLKEIEKAQLVVDVLQENYEEFLLKDTNDIMQLQNGQCYQ